MGTKSEEGQGGQHAWAKGGSNGQIDELLEACLLGSIELHQTHMPVLAA